MGFIIIDEDKLNDRLRIWNDRDYYRKAMADITGARASSEELLPALQQEQREIREKITRLEDREKSVKHLMEFASSNSKIIN